MEVVATTGQVAIYEDTVATSAPVILNGKCIIRIESIDGNKYQNGASVSDPALPYDGAPYTSNPQWVIVLVQNDRAIEKLEMGKITNHLGDWTNDLAGTIQAATDLSVAFQSPGGGGGGIDTIDGGTTGYSFSAGPNSVMTGSPVVPIPYGRTIFVDNELGSDTTGTPYRFDLPYATFAAAIEDASNGDTVVLRPSCSDTIADSVSSPGSLHIVIEPGIHNSSIIVAITESATTWSIYGPGCTINTVTINGGSRLIMTVRGTSNVTVLGSSILDLYGNVDGYVVVSGTVTLNNGVAGSAIQINDGSTTTLINYHAAGGIDCPGIGVNVDARSSSTTAITGPVSINGDMFTIAHGGAGSVATQSADGSWTWV